MLTTSKIDFCVLFIDGFSEVDSDSEEGSEVFAKGHCLSHEGVRVVSGELFHDLTHLATLADENEGVLLILVQNVGELARLLYLGHVVVVYLLGLQLVGRNLEWVGPAVILNVKHWLTELAASQIGSKFEHVTERGEEVYVVGDVVDAQPYGVGLDPALSGAVIHADLLHVAVALLVQTAVEANPGAVDAIEDAQGGVQLLMLHFVFFFGVEHCGGLLCDQTDTGNLNKA